LPRVAFEEADIETWQTEDRFDLIFANAVLQWIPDHLGLIPRFISFLKKGGCLAVQMPNNLDEPSHRLMTEVAKTGPWAVKLNSATAAREKIGSFEDYYACLIGAGCTVDLWQTTYVHPLDGPRVIVEWFKSTGLRPHLDPLSSEEKAEYLSRYAEEIAKAYPMREDGKVLLRFPRLFFVAQRL
jgi:trans-aconitate 2-methyltransferase